LAAAIAGAAVGWLGWTLLAAAGRPEAAVSRLVPAVLGLGGFLAGLGAWFAHRRFHVFPRYTAPRRALAVVALAKAAALTGAALAGAYIVLAVANIGRWPVPGPRQRVVFGAASALAALCLMAGGLILERECQTRHGGEDDASDRD
jgi:hypothetical protein